MQFKIWLSFEFIIYLIVHTLKSNELNLKKSLSGIRHYLIYANKSIIVLVLFYLSVFLLWMVVVLVLVVRL